MRPVKATPAAWTFALNERERDFLTAVLLAYPTVPRDYPTLSRESASRLSPEDEELLRESLQEQRSAHSAKVKRWLKGGVRFQPVGEEWHFRLVRTDLDWLLQVLNDVRVGHWLQLGSPEDIHNPIELLQKNPSAFFHMEAAGMFEMELLAALQEPSDLEE